MSPFKLSVNRKRRRYFDSSDSDSDDGIVTLKKSCEHSNFSTRVRRLMSWVSELKVNKYFLRSMKLGSSVPVTVIDDDDSDDVKEVDDEVVIVDEVQRKGRQNPFYDRTKTRHAFMNGTLRRSSRLNDSFICATNGFTNLSLSSAKNSRNGACKNGFYEENVDSFGKTTNGISKSSKPKVLAPITNPETDIQILGDTHRKSDADDIVLLSEHSDSKLSGAHSKRTMRTRSSYNVSDCSIARSKVCHEKDEDDDRIPDPAACIGNPFTAFEVIRLQEKKQYQELLDKYMKNQLYQPVKKTPVVDVEPESSNELLNLDHCNREVLQQPLDSYLQQYYEPFKTSEEPSEKPQEQQMPDVKVSEDEVLEIDDDISILKVTLPRFKLKYDRKPSFADAEWLSELQFQVRAQAEERQRIEADHLRTLDKMRRDRLRKQVLKAIEPRKELARKSIEIPEITPEMNAIIDKALSWPPDYKVAHLDKASLMKRDIETLLGLNWLNDEVINYYMQLIVERSKKNKNYPSVYAYNTFFYTNLKNKGYSTIKRWTRRDNVFEYDLLLVPLHLDIHWALAVIYPAKKKIEYYDSMSSSEVSCLTLLSDYMVKELKDKHNLDETSEYCLEKMNAPIQMNGSDCGMFTLKYAEYISRNATMNFDQANIPYFRRRMIYELLTNTLL